MWQDYWRRNGPYLLPAGIAQLGAYALILLGQMTGFGPLTGLGVLVVVVSGLVLLRYAFLPLLIALLAVGAVLAVVGVLIAALIHLLHPVLLWVLGIAAVAFGVALAGAWWGDHGDAVLDRLAALWRDRRQHWRRLRAPRAPVTATGHRLVAAPRTPAVALRLTPIANPIRMVATPRCNRRCRACGRWIPAESPVCTGDDCPFVLEREA